jgi:hypothetical protein
MPIYYGRGQETTLKCLESVSLISQVGKLVGEKTTMQISAIEGLLENINSIWDEQEVAKARGGLMMAEGIVPGPSMFIIKEVKTHTGIIKTALETEGYGYRRDEDEEERLDTIVIESVDEQSEYESFTVVVDRNMIEEYNQYPTLHRFHP